MSNSKPVVVIVGAGFGGLAAARGLKHFDGTVIVIDRNNHHLFQPLLYQVATSVLAPGQTASPIRSILASQTNTTVIQAEVTGVDTQKKVVLVENAHQKNVAIAFDYLVLATGVQLNYFGHDEFRKYAPGLKSLADAESIRNRILEAFELAEAEQDPTKHQDFLTFALVGAGPTGVEMAGALAIMVKSTLKRQFRRIDPAKARIILVDAAERPLATFAPELSAKATKRLERLGVETLYGHPVSQVTEEGLQVGTAWIPCRTVIWTAGVTPSPAGKWLTTETDKAGRVRVLSDLSVAGMPTIFVVGDTSSKDQDGKPLPGVAQVAMQGGAYVAKAVLSRSRGTPAPKPFRYFDKGNLAVVGRGFAVLQSGPVKMSGLAAWFVWAVVHIQFLAQPGLRLSVALQWIWTFMTGQRGSRLIVRKDAAN